MAMMVWTRKMSDGTNSNAKKTVEMCAHVATPSSNRACKKSSTKQEICHYCILRFSIRGFSFFYITSQLLFPISLFRSRYIRADAPSYPFSRPFSPSCLPLTLCLLHFHQIPPRFVFFQLFFIISLIYIQILLSHFHSLMQSQHPPIQLHHHHLPHS